MIPESKARVLFVTALPQGRVPGFSAALTGTNGLFTGVGRGWLLLRAPRGLSCRHSQHSHPWSNGKLGKRTVWVIALG